MARPSPHRFRKLDIRPILRRGEEPFAPIMARVAALRPGEGLELTAPFMPAPLVELLGSQGFEADMEHSPEGNWVVWFWKTS